MARFLTTNGPRRLLISMVVSLFMLISFGTSIGGAAATPPRTPGDKTYFAKPQWWTAKVNSPTQRVLANPLIYAGSGYLSQDQYALYEIYIPGGYTIDSVMAADAGTDFDLLFFGPLPDGPLLRVSDGLTYPEQLSYTVPSNAAGTYGLVVNSWSGSGNYEVYWDLIPPPPRARVSTPYYSTTNSKTNTFHVGWGPVNSADLGRITGYDVQYRANLGGTWKALKSNTLSRAYDFKGWPGNKYYFRARTRADGLIGSWSALQATILPYDEGKAQQRSGFGIVYANASSDFYLGTFRESRRAGEWLAFTFNGNSVAVVGTRALGRSKAKVYVDGVYKKTIDTYASSLRPRQIVYKASLPYGRHVIKVENLATSGRPKLDIDGFGVGK